MPQYFTGKDSVTGKQTDVRVYGPTDIGYEMRDASYDAANAGLYAMHGGNGVKPITKESAAAAALYAVLVIAVLCVVVFGPIMCAPLWLRVWIRPDLIRKYALRSLLMFVAVGMLYFFSRENRAAVPFFHAYLAFGIGTLVMAGVQYILSSLRPKLVKGPGYGLLNIFALVLPFKPIDLLTKLQDALLLLLFFPVARIIVQEVRLPIETSLFTLLLASAWAGAIGSLWLYRAMHVDPPFKYAEA